MLHNAKYAARIFLRTGRAIETRNVSVWHVFLRTVYARKPKTNNSICPECIITERIVADRKFAERISPNLISPERWQKVYRYQVIAVKVVLVNAAIRFCVATFCDINIIISFIL